MRSKIDKDWLIYLSGFLLLSGVFLSPPGEPARRQLLGRALPVSRAIYSWSVSQKEQADTSAQVRTDLEIQRLRQENKSLRAALSLDTKPLKYTSAEVIAAKSDSLHRALVIGIGSDLGARPGQAVLSGDFLVGLIIESNATTSVVRLISDPDFKAAVNVGNSNLPGLATGDLTGLKLSRIPLSEDLKEGDLVTTSSVGGNLPANLSVGRLANPSSEDPIFWRGVIDSPISLDRLLFVQVVIE